MKTDPDDPNRSLVEKLKELMELIDKADLSAFTDRKTKIYDLYPLRENFEFYEDGNSRFRLEQMADAGEFYDELLGIIFQNWNTANIKLKLEKHYTCACGVSEAFPMNDNCMILILIADTFIMDYTLNEEDDSSILIDLYGRFPKAVRHFLTRDLVYLEKEHLRKCKFAPDDWKKKTIRFN